MDDPHQFNVYTWSNLLPTKVFFSLLLEESASIMLVSIFGFNSLNMIICFWAVGLVQKTLKP